MNQSLVWHQVIIVFLITSSFFAVAQQGVASAALIDVYSSGVVHRETVQNVFPQEVAVEKLTFEADVVFQQEEFLYLIDFSVGDCVDAAAIISAVERLVKKNKFLSISITVVLSDAGVCLHWEFTSLWTFRKIKLHGVYQGKHPFFQYYLMERGDVFDQEKHDHSVAKIKDFLANEGYLDHQITTIFERDDATKEVTVHITINKGKRFCFGAMSVELSAHDIVSDCQELQGHICKRLSTALSSQYYKKELLNGEIASLKDYLAKKGFLQVAIELQKNINNGSRQVEVTWKITLYQKRAIVFFGHNFFSKKELLDKILAFGRSAWLLPASLLAEEIVRAYKSKGFWSVEVATQEEKERTFFVIKEGPRATIKAVTINNGTYGDQIKIKKQCFSTLLKHSYYDAKRYDESIDLLTTFYVDCGFLSFVVVDHSFVPGEQEHEYTLVVTVDEGVQKYVTTVSVEGFPELNKQGPFGTISFASKPQLFTMKMLEEQRVWLADCFQRQGYLRPRFKPVIESHNEKVSLCWVVDCGEKIRFGKTVILGSSTFPFPYVSSLLNYHQGDLWDQRKIKKTFVSLKELEVFETIHLMTDYTESDEEKPVILKLQLDDRYEVRARAGLELQHVRKYQTFSGLTYKIGGTALIKNPSICGDQLRLDLDFARSHREVVGRYRRPWLVRWPFSTIFQVYSISYDQPAFHIDSYNDIYTLKQNGFFLGLQKKTDHCDVGLNNGFEWMKLHIKDSEEQLSFAHAIDFEPQLIDKMVPFFFIEPTIMFESLDNALNPTSGGTTLFSLKGMIPVVSRYKDSSFFKALFEQSLFISIKSVVAALRFRCGHIFYREFSGIMPSERFYLGGSHSLRGYEADLAPPLGVFVDDNGKQHVVPRGGRTMVNANVELRFPVYKKVGAVVFQDVGALSGRLFADFKRADALAATGFGLRVHTPLGPLRFDIGWRWHKQIPIERSCAWFLTFGQAF